MSQSAAAMVSSILKEICYRNTAPRQVWAAQCETAGSGASRVPHCQLRAPKGRLQGQGVSWVQITAPVGKAHVHKVAHRDRPPPATAPQECSQGPECGRPQPSGAEGTRRRTAVLLLLRFKNVQNEVGERVIM